MNSICWLMCQANNEVACLKFFVWADLYQNGWRRLEKEWFVELQFKCQLNTITYNYSPDNQVYSNKLILWIMKFLNVQPIRLPGTYVGNMRCVNPRTGTLIQSINSLMFIIFINLNCRIARPGLDDDNLSFFFLIWTACVPPWYFFCQLNHPFKQRMHEAWTILNCLL